MKTNRRAALAALAALCLAAPAALADETGHAAPHGEMLHLDAGDFVLHDPHVRAVSPAAPNAAAYFGIENVSDHADRLIGVRSPAARKASLHTTERGEDGVARMKPIAGGVPLAPGAMHVFAPGGDHVMLMGLTRRLKAGDEVTLTLIFEQAGEVDVTLPVDNRMRAGGMDHGAHGEGHGAGHGQGHGHGQSD